MSKHTPGPWYGVGAWVEVEDHGVADICSCNPDDYAQGHLGRNYDEICANARLIAAAPELLEALEAIVSTRNAEARAIKSYDNARENFSRDGYEYRAMVNAMQKASDAEKLAKQAIAKAKGE
jgi:hypothetical protein